MRSGPRRGNRHGGIPGDGSCGCGFPIRPMQGRPGRSAGAQSAPAIRRCHAPDRAGRSEPRGTRGSGLTELRFSHPNRSVFIVIKFPPGLDWKLRFTVKPLVLFVLLLGSLYGFWMRRSPWYCSGPRDWDPSAKTELSTFSSDNARTLRTRPVPGKTAVMRLILLDSPADEGGDLFDFGEHEVGGGFGFHDDDTVWIVDGRNRKILVYERRRPEWWWGVYRLPEFWLVLVFGVSAAWSLKADPE